jgi:hypothetical protein
MQHYHSFKLIRFCQKEFDKLNDKKRFGLIFVFFLSLLFSYAQNKTISGVISDEDGMPLPGVNIIEKGTTNGVASDFDGNYTITVANNNATLVVSYVGFITQEVSVTGRNTMNLTLLPNLEALDEIVVIGYGTARKSDLTGSVVTIGGDDVKEQAISSVAEALTGRLAGVQVTSTEGSPDADITIRVRGGGSLTQDSSPLIIIDGFPVNSMSDVSPSEIENISILKDA